MARGPGRRILNAAYLRVGLSRAAWVHGHFAKLFRDGYAGSVEPGSWAVEFCGRRLSIPLTSSRIWLDWDTAVSVVGHDAEVKETYAGLLGSADRPELFVDVGANYGTHSLLFMSHGVKTLTFEPNSLCRAVFRELCVHNGLEPELEGVALGDRAGTVELSYPERDTWLGSTNDRAKAGFVTGRVVSETVPQKRLDDYLEHLRGRRVLLKIDTEGSEEEVLAGARVTLREVAPLIVFEAWGGDNRRGLFGMLSGACYEIRPLPWTAATSEPAFSLEEFLAARGTNFIAVPARLRRGNTWSGPGGGGGSAA